MCPTSSFNTLGEREHFLGERPGGLGRLLAAEQQRQGRIPRRVRLEERDASPRIQDVHLLIQIEQGSAEGRILAVPGRAGCTSRRR